MHDYIPPIPGLIIAAVLWAAVIIPILKAIFKKEN